MDALSIGWTPGRGRLLCLPDALQPPHHANDLTLEHEWDIQVATVGVTPLAPTTIG